jgi:hypothetical protein
MTKKHVTLDELAQMVARGFEAAASKKMLTDEINGVRGDLRTLREDVGILRSDMEAGFQDLERAVRPLSERVNVHDVEIHDLRQRITRLEKRKRTATGR